MSVKHFYGLCCKHRGKVVRLTDRAGRAHVGRIINVTPSHVYIQPIRRNLGGFGYGFFGPGFGFGGFHRPFAVPLAFLTGLAVGGLFFW